MKTKTAQGGKPKPIQTEISEPLRRQLKGVAGMLGMHMKDAIAEAITVWVNAELDKMKKGIEE